MIADPAAQRRLQAKAGTYMADLVANKNAPALARELVAELEHELPSATLADLELIVSELVTNSAKYGQGRRISLELRREGGFVRGLVRDRLDSDPAIDLPPLPAAEAGRAGRWGLTLVDSLSDDWGVDDGGSSVWFTIEALDRCSQQFPTRVV